ncbi:unnamed protein product, partial [Amoebophrya sp. A25]|eukprot:GSA25T00017347001.1
MVQKRGEIGFEDSKEAIEAEKLSLWKKHLQKRFAKLVKEDRQLIPQTVRDEYARKVETGEINFTTSTAKNKKANAGRAGRAAGSSILTKTTSTRAETTSSANAANAKPNQNVGAAASSSSSSRAKNNRPTTTAAPASSSSQLSTFNTQELPDSDVAEDHDLEDHGHGDARESSSSSEEEDDGSSSSHSEAGVGVAESPGKKLPLGVPATELLLNAEDQEQSRSPLPGSAMKRLKTAGDGETEVEDTSGRVTTS